jgi:hypothetical protein
MNIVLVIVFGLFSFPVVHAPYISRDPNTLTQYTSMGFVAHTYLGGSKFSKIQPGEIVILTYSDGHREFYRVTHIYQYQALTDRDFRDMNTGEYVDQNTLFHKAYQPGQVTFQTCISKDGQLDYGRLFVIAEPDLTRFCFRADTPKCTRPL